MKKIGTVTAVLACACTSLLSGITAARFTRRTQKQQRLEICVPEGQLVVYPSGDPDYPGVHIELKKDDIPYMLNLTTVEYNMDKGSFATRPFMTSGWIWKAVFVQMDGSMLQRLRP